MITKRLKCILNHIPQCYTAADIGTDHAYIPIELIEKGICNRVIACDLNKGPIKIAEENIKKRGLSDKIETRMGDGLSPLNKDEADIIIIAGMGGEIIEDILRANEDIARASKIILQPMNSQYELRRYLIENGYTIINEDLALEGFKVYNIMEVRNGCQEPYKDDFYYQIPPILYSHPNFKMLCQKKHREFLKVTTGLEKSSDSDKEKYKKYKYFLEKCEELYEGI